ncbi:MAG: 50S ribosomal protein L25, partial [Xanthomonadales bacterium]|nr:50S ribosomal protein L25 [Xanthomonadales bacterium]
NDVQKAVLRDIQRHPYKKRVLHLDFQRINEAETLRIRVPLNFLNQAGSPAGKTGGCVILHELNDIEIECLPKDLPEHIDVDLSQLAVGDIVHLSDIKLPAGVEVPELKFGKEHDVAVVSAKMSAVAADDEEAEGGEEGESA